MRFLGQAALCQNVLFAVVECIHRLDQHIVAHFGLLCVSHRLVLQGAIIGQPVLPFTSAFFAIAHRDIERAIAAHHHPAVHIDDFLLRHAQIGRDLGHVFG